MEVRKTKPRPKRRFLRREYGVGDFLDRTNAGRDLADAARKVAEEERRMRERIPTDRPVN
jgi:hypothetical protein